MAAMRRESPLKISTRLALALAGSALLAFTVVGIGLLAFESWTMEKRVQAILDPYAELVSVGSEAAIAFDDGARAREILDTFRSNPQILAAEIVLENGRPLASYGDAKRLEGGEERRQGGGLYMLSGQAELVQELPYNARLHLVMSLEGLNSGTRRMLVAFASGIFLVLIASNLGLRIVLQKTLVTPITALASAVEHTRTTADYSSQVPVSGRDEIAKLASEFNIMLKTIEERDSALRHLTRFQGAILDNAPYGIITTDPDGLVTSFSPAAECLLGYSAAEVLGKTTPLKWHDPDELAAFTRKVSESTGREVGPGFEVFTHRTSQAPSDESEWSFIRKDGTRVPTQLSVTTLHDENGAVWGYLGITYDLTEKKKVEAEKAELQKQLLQAQKMESIGRLAGGVAHDFNNMLGVILGYAELSLDFPDLDPKMRSNLKEIKRASERSAALTRQLLAFARRQPSIPKVLDLNSAVDGLLTMLRRMIGEDIELQFEAGHDLWKVEMDPSHVDQVLANLCINARDAITGPGRIEIRTSNAKFDSEYCSGHRGYEPGSFVMLSVSDSGCGMNAETLGQIFEPFFTTKELGQGTGLGLATVYGLVKQNEGLIDVSSRPGEGSTFQIFLPRHLGAGVEKEEQKRVAAQVSPGEETILLVEDELAILKLVQHVLERAGYCVLPAQSPAEAVKLGQQHRGRIDLLITDVVLPEMNGWDLMSELRKKDPELRPLFMSGYTADIIADHGVLETGGVFLHKPFMKDDLLLKVREILGSPA